MRKYEISLILASVFSLILGLNQSYALTRPEGDPELLDALVKLEIPLLVIDTEYGEEPTFDYIPKPEGAWGDGIGNASKVPSRMRIIQAGDTIYDSGKYVKKESGLTIKIRGNTSGRNPKRSYKLKLQKKEDLLFRGEKKYRDKDWVLLRNGSSLVSPVGFWTSKLIGQDWTPAHRIVNLWMNGIYRGLYILCEQVTVVPGSRIDVDEKDGYVVESDPYWWTEDISFSSTLTVPQFKFTYKYPDPEDITEEWHEAVSSDVVANEAKITDGSFDEAYDCESFAKWLVGWDLLGNADSAGGNMYLVKKDASSKLCMGPMWDFDGSFGIENDWIGLHYRWFYFHYLLNSPNDSFRRAYGKVWRENGRFVVENVIQRLDDFVNSSVGRDYQESLKLQEKYFLQRDYHAMYGDLEHMRDYVVEYLTRRADWIDSQIEEVSSVEEVESLIDDINSEQTFDVLGRRISPDAPGLQIRIGKKIFKKQ